PLGVVLGTFGVERSRITWRGQAAHAGSTPMDRRRDALAGAAKLAQEIRSIAREVGDGAVCTSGGVVCRPGIVTSVVETAEQLLDQRHLDAGKLASMLAAAQEASERFAAEEDVEVAWERIWSIEPILFDETLIGFAEEAVGARRRSAALGLGLAVGWSIGDVGAVADRLSHAYGVRLGLIGLLTTSLFLVQTVTQIPAGRAIDRLGARTVGIAALGLIALG